MNKRVIEGIVISVISALLLSMFFFLVEIHDTINYELPEYNAKQDTMIHYLAQQIKTNEKTAKEKNTVNQKRIDRITDGWRIIDKKIDGLIETQKDFNRRQKFIFKTVKELKPYSDLLTLKDTI